MTPPCLHTLCHVNLQFFPLKKREMLPHSLLVGQVIALVNGAVASMMQAEVSNTSCGRFVLLCFCHRHQNMIRMACWSQEDKEHVKQTQPLLTIWN